MSKKTLLIIILIILVVGGGFYYWFFIKGGSLSLNLPSGSANNPGNGIFASSGGNGNQATGSSATSSASSTLIGSIAAPAIPALRELSSMPVGGMEASTTASTTIVRWIDRGTGHIYQAYADNTAIDELSNTTVPMVAETYWNTAATAFIFRTLTEDSDSITNFYAQLSPVSNTTATTTGSSTISNTPYELRGTSLPAGTLAIAVSPAAGNLANQVFTLSNDGNGGANGYISNFDGTKKTTIFDTPLAELNVQWPAANTIALTTKGSDYGSGFLYFVNPKNGVFNKIIGGIRGLSTLVNADASEVVYARTSANGIGITTSIYNVKTGQSQNLPFNTMPEKCVWSTLQKTELYCAVPFSIPSADYPDAWYQGRVSLSDSIWEIDTTTGAVHQLVDLLKTSGTTIDAINLELGPNENFLYFMNKNDLSLWSFNLYAI
jgi:hypothetical protein